MIDNIELVNGIVPAIYGTSKFHRILYTEKNIGDNAENLTIVVLTYNRVKATLKLIKSLIEIFPEYKGKLVILDNGSSDRNLKILEKYIEKTELNIEFIKSDKNLGVAKGRNEAIKHVKTEWAMFLDNDIYFIKNIFPEIRNTIAQFGCKFLNLPLLNIDKKTIFSYGGNIFINDLNNNLHIGCGSTYKQKEIIGESIQELCMGTFLFGGCSVLNVKKFIECGLFDENMKVGFEDIDFSIRLFNEGYKIGCCNVFGLVHNHEQSDIEDDLEYEKIRFSSKMLLESAMYFEKKHHLKIWSEDTEKWLKQREKELGIVNNNTDKLKKPDKLKKIALVVDTRNWALDNIAKNIVNNLKDKYEFKIIYMDEIPDMNIVLIFYACAGCDLIHFLWRGHLHFFYGDFVKAYLDKYNGGFEAFRNNVMNTFTITTSIYDHQYLEEDINFTKEILELVNGYTVSSKKLLNIYNNLKVKKPYMEITDGVNLDEFYPINLERFEAIKNRDIVIGWVGNSKWSGDESKDHKGLNTIIKPAVEELIKEGYRIKLDLADKQEKFIPHNEMVKYYSNIDLYVCTSLNEGTPNPILEAMACGVPVISTDVGIVSEALGDEQKKFILEERTKDCLKEKIKLFIKNLEQINELSIENLEKIKNWDWKNKCMQFDEFFRKNINGGTHEKIKD